jgi:uncharacterized delta-60 repeat protein
MPPALYVAARIEANGVRLPVCGVKRAAMALRVQPAELTQRRTGRAIQTSLWIAMLTGLVLPFAQTHAAPGELDSAFRPEITRDDVVSVVALVLQADGAVLIGGSFTSVNGASRNGIARLNSDGTLDTTFDPGTGATTESLDGTVYPMSVYSIALQGDGRVVIGGNFALVNGVSRSRVARLNADGTLDSSFNPGSVAAASFDSTFTWLRRVIVQTDGRILIMGHFDSVEGVARNGIARLHPNGSLDHSFNPGSQLVGIDPRPVINSVVVQPDGKVLVAGYFDSYEGLPRNGIMRVNPDWTLDTSFDPGTGVEGEFLDVVLQTDGKLLIAGNFSSVNGMSRRNIARLHADGSVDATFEATVSDTATGGNGLLLQPDGRIVVGIWLPPDASHAFGYFKILRLHPDGSVDPGFAASETDAPAVASALQPDGKVLVRGAFVSVNGIAQAAIARLQGDGPQLTMRPSGANVTVSWPSSWPGFALQETSGPGMPWSHVALPATDDGTTVSVTVPTAEGHKLFRAMKP